MNNLVSFFSFFFLHWLLEPCENVFFKKEKQHCFFFFCCPLNNPAGQCLGFSTVSQKAWQFKSLLLHSFSLQQLLNSALTVKKIKFYLKSVKSVADEASLSQGPTALWDLKKGVGDTILHDNYFIEM